MSSSELHEFELTGLFAEDPLAYLAALGCLYVLDATEMAEREAPTLHFEIGGSIRPIVRVAVSDDEELLDRLETDITGVRGDGDAGDPLADPFLNWSYPDAEDDELAAVLSDVAADLGGKKAKPFALHFTAGNQRSLQIGYELLKGVAHGDGYEKNKHPVDREDLREAIFGPWRNARALKVFSWSPSQERNYALWASDPSKDKKTGVPGADWLALRSLALLSSAPEAGRICTGGVHGGWKRGTFTYPVWSHPLSARAVRSLQRHPDLVKEAAGRSRSSHTLPAGVELLTCAIRRSDQGGYGSFMPPDRRVR